MAINNDDGRRPITILWATQSGRAKACARRTIRLLHSAVGITAGNIQGQCSFDDFGADRFLSLGCYNQQQTNATYSNGSGNGGSCNDDNQQKRLLLMFVSTTGDAEQCSTIQSTWSKLLSKSLPHTTFQHVQFALFALGDRAYGPDAYCAAGRKVAARLHQLSAEPICPLGYGDDGSLNGGVFADLDVWLETHLFPTLQTMVKAENLIAVDMNITTEVPASSTGNDNRANKRYTVKVLDALDSTEKDVALHEWQNDRFHQHYAYHFQHSCPASAYEYCNDTLKRRRTQCNADSNANEINSKSPPLLGRVNVNKRITANDWMQNTRHIRINVIGSMGAVGNRDATNSNSSSVTEQHEALPYQAGDVATILPSNPETLVTRFLSVLPTAMSSIADEAMHIQYNPNSTHSSMNNHPWPQYCTLRGLLTHCADIQSLPEREDLFALSSFCNLTHNEGKDQREKLISLSETSGAALYGDYIIREKRNWVDVLYDFDSIRLEQDGAAKMTIEDLLSMLPSLAPRHFSIASSPSFIRLNQKSTRDNGFELELCVAVVEGKTPFGRPYTGCCSKYLDSISPRLDDQTSSPDGSDIVRLWIHPGSFSKLPMDVRRNPTPQHYFATPAMYIGAGTGIAPLRSLILEREAARMNAGATVTASSSGAESNGDGSNDNILVFGCRKKESDYYYGEEWGSLLETNRLRLIPAFSRDQKHKLYVQRALREADGGSGALIIQHMIENNGAVYIAGGSKMARAVKDEIVEALESIVDKTTAKKLLNRLKRTGQFSIEAWS